ncbi:hypothetical protein [Pseudomonas sp. PS02288]|nr:hypothetical protein [Pseudomonas sp. PS02288]
MGEQLIAACQAEMKKDATEVASFFIALDVMPFRPAVPFRSSRLLLR